MHAQASATVHNRRCYQIISATAVLLYRSGLVVSTEQGLDYRYHAMQPSLEESYKFTPTAILPSDRLRIPSER